MKASTKNALIVSFIYCLFGTAWIYASDKLLLKYTNIINIYQNVQSIKGILFVVSSALLIFFIVLFLYKNYDSKLRDQFSIQQKSMEKNEKRFRALIENTEDIISLTDEKGNIIYVSPAFERITGFKLDEMRGKPSISTMHPDQINESKHVLKELLNNPGVAIPRTNRLLHKNGNYIYVEGSVTNLLHDQNIEAIVTNYRDITQKIKSEQQAIFDHNNLKALINNTNDLMWSVDLDFKLINSNKAFNKMVALMSGKEIKKGDSVLSAGFSEEQLKKYKSLYERAFSGEIFTEIEHTVEPEDIWSEISFYPIFNEGTISGTACFSRDITERKLAERRMSKFTVDLLGVKNKLEHNESRLRQAQEIAHVGSWELDLESGIVIWSDESCRIHGVPVGENKQTFESWLTFVHPDDLNFVIQKVKEGEASMQNYFFHHRILRKDGTIRFIYAQCHFELNSNGKAIGLYGISQDVTEQKKAEQEILRKNIELRDLSNHLQYAREKERSTIAREIHDELGQQLSVLKMDIGWVIHKQNNPDEAVTSKLQEILRFSDNLIVTVRKISSDLRPAIIDDLGLVAAMEWVCDDFQEKTEIPCYFTSDIEERRFDEMFSITTYRILQESLTNILRHSKAKSVNVSIHETPEYLFLEIVDDGKGISDECTAGKKTLGVLGMKERAAQLGGELVIEGIESKGTSVKLKIPLT